MEGAPPKDQDDSFWDYAGVHSSQIDLFRFVILRKWSRSFASDSRRRTYAPFHPPALILRLRHEQPLEDSIHWRY